MAIHRMTSPKNVVYADRSMLLEMSGPGEYWTVVQRASVNFLGVKKHPLVVLS